MAEVGRKTDLTEELFRKIKKSILDGNDLRTTAKVCEIPESTLYTWHSDNYLNISDKIEGWKRDYKLKLANQNIVEFLKMSDKNVKQVGEELVEYRDTGLTKVKADMSKFVAETLGKDEYSKRSELTGAGGEKLIPEDKKLLEDLSDKLNEVYERTNKSGDGA